jgi:hypothetical protein
MNLFPDPDKNPFWLAESERIGAAKVRSEANSPNTIKLSAESSLREPGELSAFE